MLPAFATIIALLATAPSAAGPLGLSPADEAAAFRAAGFSRVGDQWRACDAPADSIYAPGKIEAVRDLNEDGRPEAIITEGSTFCFGGAEVGFTLVSKQADGVWKVLLSSPGVAEVLSARGRGGWPDILIGAQGFCFPVLRWENSGYEIDRFEYEGEACEPD